MDDELKAIATELKELQARTSMLYRRRYELTGYWELPEEQSARLKLDDELYARAKILAEPFIKSLRDR